MGTKIQSSGIRDQGRRYMVEEAKSLNLGYTVM